MNANLFWALGWFHAFTAGFVSRTWNTRPWIRNIVIPVPIWQVSKQIAQCSRYGLKSSVYSTNAWKTSATKASSFVYTFRAAAECLRCSDVVEKLRKIDRETMCNSKRSSERTFLCNAKLSSDPRHTFRTSQTKQVIRSEFQMEASSRISMRWLLPFRGRPRHIIFIFAPGHDSVCFGQSWLRALNLRTL